MNTQLKHSFTQYRLDGTPQSSLIITVAYDTDERLVENIISVYAYNSKYRTYTDITHILDEQFPNALNSMVDSIDWAQVYAESGETVCE